MEKHSLSSSLEQRKKGQEDKFKLLLSDKEKEWNKKLEDRISREEKDKQNLEKKISDLTNERNVLIATKEQEIQNKLLSLRQLLQIMNLPFSTFYLCNCLTKIFEIFLRINIRIIFCFQLKWKAIFADYGFYKGCYCCCNI